MILEESSLLSAKMTSFFYVIESYQVNLVLIPSFPVCAYPVISAGLGKDLLVEILKDAFNGDNSKGIKE